MSEKGFETDITLDKTPHFDITEEKPLKTKEPKKNDFIDGDYEDIEENDNDKKL